MIRQYTTFVLLVLTNSNFGMKPIFEEEAGWQEQKLEEYPLLEKLRHEPTSFLSILSRELINELERHIASIANAQLKDAIKPAKSLAEAVEKLKELSAQLIHAHHFQDPKFTDTLIYTLVNKFFEESVESIVNVLGTFGAQRWLQEIRPQQKELMAAAQNGDLEKIKKLIAQGVNVNSRTFDNGKNFHTPLMIALLQDHLAISSYLIEHGADVNVQAFHWNPLMCAISAYNVESVSLLLKHGANPIIETHSDTSAINYAEQLVYVGIIEILQEAIQEMSWKQQAKR